MTGDSSTDGSNSNFWKENTTFEGSFRFLTILRREFMKVDMNFCCVSKVKRGSSIAKFAFHSYIKSVYRLILQAFGHTLYWSAWAWRPMIMGFVQPVTKRGMFLHIMASRNTVPPKILRMVPFGDFHIFFNLNSSTLTSSGVMVAHF